MSLQNSILEVGLFQVPVKLDKVADRDDPEFDSASPDGNPTDQVYQDIVTKELHPRGLLKKGVWGQKPKDKSQWADFKEISPNALAAIEEETKIDALVIDKFIPLSEVPFERAVGCYFLSPQKGVSAKPLRVLYEALKLTKRAGVVKLTLRTRQQPAVIYAKNGGLYVNTLVFASDFTRSKAAEDVLAQTQADPKQVALAKQLIESMSTDASALDALTDDVRPLRQKLIEEALAGKALSPSKKAPVNPKQDGEQDAMMAALRASVEALQKKKDKASSAKQPVAA